MIEKDTAERIRDLTTRHRIALMSRDKERMIQTFLASLFSPFYQEACLSLDYTLSLIANMYKKADKTKDEAYVKNVLENILNRDMHKQLRIIISDYLETDGKNDGLSWFLYDIVVDIYFYDKRTQLLSWAEEAIKLRDEGHRKFIINAPMGLGKTYAMSKILATGRYTAVVFSPDKLLRNHMVKKINRIAGRNLAVMIEGIEEGNCRRYEKIIGARKQFRNIKPSECKQCLEKDRHSCKTWNQKWDACKSKVLVTTHAQYEVFYRSEFLKNWYDKETNTWKPRDLFVIDENIIDKHLSEVPCLSLTDLNQYHGIINKYWTSRNTDFKDAINKIWEPISLRGKSIFIPYINKEFKFDKSESGKLYHLMKKAYKKEDIKMPKENIKGLLTHAIRIGCTYDEHSKLIYFNVVADKAYPLGEEIPIHVFFDGTDVPEFLMKRIFPERNQPKIPRKEFEIPPLGKLTLYHTNNCDLPRRRVKDFVDRLDIYCKRIIKKYGEGARYFTVVIGQGKDAKVYEGYEHIMEDIFKKAKINVLKKKDDDEEKDSSEDDAHESDDERMKDNYNYAVLRHFGDLRGTNVAKDCDIGLLLGKFKVPDAVEIAWTIPYLPTVVVEEARDKGYVEIDSMKEQKFKGKVVTYKYSKEFSAVNMMAKWKRSSENEQALGRTRFLFHPVVFYAITKDDLSGYGMFKEYPDKIMCVPDSFGIDLFNEKGDSMYFFSKCAIDKILKGQEGSPSPNFTEKKVEEESNAIAASYDKRGPKERAVRKHIQKYLAEHYPGSSTKEWSKPGNTWTYVTQP